MATEEVEKLQKHLGLLKQQYVKLQERYYELEQRHLQCQATGTARPEGGLVAQLVSTVAGLHEQELYSDITVKMCTRTVPAHRVVLCARSDAWVTSDPQLTKSTEVDLSHLTITAATTLLRWAYTDSMAAFSSQELVVELLSAGNQYRLGELKSKCEEWLMGSVTVRSCIFLYQVSEDHQAANLKQYCLKVISDNWSQLNRADFASLSSALLYEMFKAHSAYPLHLAIQHGREDVVFLFLVEHTTQLATKLVERDPSGDIPLDLALRMRSESIAKTLVTNKCDLDTPNEKGETLLHLAIMRGDEFAANFLICNGASTLATIAATMETPLHLTASYNPSNALTQVQAQQTTPSWPSDNMAGIAGLILEYRGNPDAQDHHGNTALHRAIQSRNKSVFDILMDHEKLNLELCNADGENPLWLALEQLSDLPDPPNLESEEVSESFASCLIAHGCNTETVDPVTGNSILQRAELQGNETAAIFLLHHGANPNHCNQRGESPLHLAALQDLPQVAQVLLSAGADPNYQTSLLPLSTDRAGGRGSMVECDSPAPSTPAESKKTTAVLQGLDLISPTALSALSALSALTGKADLPLPPHGSPVLAQAPKGHNPFGSSSDEEEEREKERSSAITALSPGHQHTAHSQQGGRAVRNPPFALPFDTNLFRAGPADAPEFLEPPQEVDPQQDSGGRSALHIAIACCHQRVVVLLLNHRGSSTSGKLSIPLNVNLYDGRGETPLGLALWTEQFDVARQLLEAGAEVEAVNRDRLTLLHLAILREREEAAMFLLESGASFQRISPGQGGAALHLAVRHRLSRVVQYLCEHGVDLKQLDNEGNSSLWAALRSGQMGMAKCLVEHGCDTNSWSPGPQGGMFSMLHRAIILRDTQSAIFLIRNGADMNCPYRYPGGEYCAPPLHLACGLGLEGVVQCLVDSRADVNQKDTDSRCPIHVAISSRHPSCSAHLLAHPALNLTLKDRSGLTPFASALKHQDHHTGLAILIKEPEAAEQYDTQGCNFLHNAIQAEDVESVMFLLSVHVDVNSKVRNQSIHTPLHLAVKKGSELLVRHLLLAGAKVADVNRHSQGVLHMAVEGNFPTILSVLLENRADPDLVDENQNTPLHLAMKLGHIECVRVLLEESRINIAIVNAQGQNVLHTLARCGQENAAAIFSVLLAAVPNFPLNVPDIDGNNALLLAYFSGHTALCDALIRSGAHPGIANKQGISIFNTPVSTKQLLLRILDQVSMEPTWLDAQHCQHCHIKFGLATRKHHCRHCGRVLCAKCTPHQLPIIKFELQKPVRLCEVCGDCLTLGAAR